MSTLPTLATRWGVGLDSLRTLVRRDAVLSRLGAHVGANRAFTEQEAAQIHAAYLAKRAARAPKAETATVG